MRLDDFFHLPALDQAIAALVAERPALVVVAGLDVPANAGAGTLLPSGRATIFRVLADQMLAEGDVRAAVVAEDANAFRLPRSARGRVASLRVPRQQSYAAHLDAARAGGADLLIVDQLTPENAGDIARVAAAGGRVLTQVNSLARSAALAREIEELGFEERGVPGLMWLVAVRRLPMLCPVCRESRPLTDGQRLRLQPGSGLDPAAAYAVAPGCEHCGQRGRDGAVALFDVCRVQRATSGELAAQAVLPLEQYAHELARQGALAFDDVVDLDGRLMGYLFQQFTAGQHALDSANQRLERTVAELRSANDVLEQRTAALVSLQAIGQALISSTDLHDLARRVCRHVRELCGADRAALYIREAAGDARIIAVSGWDAEYVGAPVDAALLAAGSSEPAPFDGWPPGIPPQHADVAGGDLRAGLCVPLIAEQQQVGMLIIHVMDRARFAPGEIALLQTFAHQAALLIQRTHLLDELNAHLARLQQAQAALVEQQRLAREMELAADVQRSILPRVFPQVPGLTFAADTRPAREVGGDFYDVFALDATSIGVVIGDVSGKGMPAALYMALTRSLLLAEARRERSPRSVLLNVNRLLREVGDPQMFVTVFYGIIDTASRRVVYARAGHDYPLLLRDGAVEQLTGAGIILGMLDITASQLDEPRMALRDGDRLVLYTDGLIDVMNDANRRLELPGLLAILERQQHAGPDAICERTFAALREYQGAAEQYDDMTIVVVGVDDGGCEGETE